MKPIQSQPSSDFFGSLTGSVLNPVTLGWILGGQEVTHKDRKVQSKLDEQYSEIERLKAEVKRLEWVRDRLTDLIQKLQNEA